MKQILMSTVVLLAGSFSHACLGEAELVAKIQSVRPVAGACAVVIDPASVSHYSANGTCVLDLQDILMSEVLLPAPQNSACEAQPGTPISGVIVKDAAGNLVLE